jgi:hypothetical protein
VPATTNPAVRRTRIDDYQSQASVWLLTFCCRPSGKLTWGLSREAPAMPVASEPFAVVYEERNRLGVIVADLPEPERRL